MSQKVAIIEVKTTGELPVNRSHFTMKYPFTKTPFRLKCSGLADKMCLTILSLTVIRLYLGLRFLTAMLVYTKVTVLLHIFIQTGSCRHS